MFNKKIFCILTIFILVISCQKKNEVSIKQTQQKAVMDTTIIDSLGERKSIHQQEWEDHKKELADTLGTE